ncbi:MAG TPA: HEAT repeat domain-containing protein [Vicinamibacterales bacterium]|nr:HEAT repeat domain-containing protein [Vicinamibacterales bacterium]
MRKAVVLVSLLACAVAVAAAQPLRFDDVVRNLRNPDPKVRVDAIHLLRQARYPEAIGPIAALVTDPVDQVQLESIAAELSFFVVDDLKTRRHVGFVIERRTPAVARAAFELPPSARWRRPAPPSLVKGLIAAIDDDQPRVRLEAVYAVGVVAEPPLAPDDSRALIKALDHSDPAVRAAAAEVIGRLRIASAGDALLRAVNDSSPDVRHAAMRALGEIHDVRAVEALTEQLKFYGTGDGAASALDALAQLGQPASVPVFKAHLTDKDPNIRRAAAEGLGRAGDQSVRADLSMAVTTDSSRMVRMAMAFALQKLGLHYVQRIVDEMATTSLMPQAESYLLELGPTAGPPLIAALQDPDAAIRMAAANALGFIGGQTAMTALQKTAGDSDPDVAAAAKRALDRLCLTTS